MKTIKNLKAEEIRKSILQLAIQGKLVKQDPNDEPASELVKRIYAEKQRLIKEGKIKKDKNESFIFKGDDNCYYEKIGNNAPVKLEDLPFDIPDSWTWIRQKNICWLDNGDKVKGKKLPYLEAKVIRGKSEPTYIDMGVIVGPECKVILVDGENSGEIMTPPFEGYMGSTFKIFSAVKSFNYEFLLFIFLLNKEKYKNSKIGAAIPHLNKELFRESLIAVPPLNEQERIVAKIIECEPLIIQYSIAEEKLSKLEDEFPDKLKKSILQYAIEGKLVKQDPNDEPASVLLERIKTEKEKLIKEGKIKRDKNESYIFQGDDKNYYEKIVKNNKVIDLQNYTFVIPDSWSWCSLSQISKLITDGTHKTPNYVANGVPFLSISNVSSGIYDGKCKFITLEEHNSLITRCKPETNDILLCRIGTLGKPFINDLTFEFSIFVSLALIKLIDKQLAYFIKIVLESPNSCSYIDKVKVGGGTHTFKINIEDLSTFPIPLAPINEQYRIIKRINYLFERINNLSY